jgi:hypothetical protein
MTDSRGSFDVLKSIQKHIKALRPFLPRQVIACIGEYPIKTYLKQSDNHKLGKLEILIEKSSHDIYSWIPKDYSPHLVLGFEDSQVDTHFWYDVLPLLKDDTSILDILKIKPAELSDALIFSSIWDGIGAASLPSLISKLNSQKIPSLSIALLPSKVQPPDAQFNAYSALQLSLVTEAATVLLLDRDQVESYVGVDRVGEPLKGDAVVNYVLGLFLSKEGLVQEISELSRTFNIKLFSALIVTGASYRIYGSLENMLTVALLSQTLRLDLSRPSLLYAILRLPSHLKDTFTRGKIELALTKWFKSYNSLYSIHVTEPVYVDDFNDRVDIVLFVGGFGVSELFVDTDRKFNALKRKAVEKGYLTEDGEVTERIIETLKVPVALVNSEISKKLEVTADKTDLSDELFLDNIEALKSEVSTTVEATFDSKKPKLQIEKE